MKYVNGTLHGTAKALVVPECGHDDRCIHTDRSMLPVIFPK